MHQLQPTLQAVPDQPRGRCDARVIADSLLDPQAFAELFDRYWVELHGFCTSRAAAGGEDLAAETFRLAFDRRARYDQNYEDARPWLYGIATNLLRQYFRSAQRRGRAEDRSAAQIPANPAAEEPLSRLERQLLGPNLAAALEHLTPAECEALLLYAWADMEYAEIARALDVPLGTVRSRIHRARQRTQTFLNQGNRHDA